METPIVYVICDNNCKYEGMTKEQIITAIYQAIESGTVGDCDTGFITTVKTINGQGLRFFVGTQSEYDALSDDDKSNLFAIITNDTTKDGLLNAIAELQEAQANIDNTFTAITSGNYTIPKASHAVNADYAERARAFEGFAELLHDDTNGGFRVSETGVYVIIGVLPPNAADLETTAYMRTYKSDIVIIPHLSRISYGIGGFASYSSYDIADVYQGYKYRLRITDANYNDYKAYKIMSL